MAMHPSCDQLGNNLLHNLHRSATGWPRAYIVLALILVSALMLRFSNIRFGASIHYDENKKFTELVNLLSGRGPGTFRHPSLMINAVLVVDWLKGYMRQQPVDYSKASFKQVIVPGRYLMAIIG